MDEFSAQYYADMSGDQFRTEAENLGVNLYGLNKRQQIDAVYNAELRRRQAELEQQELDRQQAEADESGVTFRVDANTIATVGGEQQTTRSTGSRYESMTVADLRDEAERLGVDLEGRTRKAEIIDALEASEGDA